MPRFLSISFCRYNFFIKRVYILLFCVPLSLFGKDKTGIKDKSNNVIPYYIDIEKNINNIKSVNLSEIGSSLEYIPLETSTDLIIGSLNKVVLYNDLFFYNVNLMMPMQTDEIRYSWCITDSNGNIISKIESPVKKIKSPFLVPPDAPLYMHGNYAHFTEHWTDSLYYLVDGKPNLYASFNRGRLALSPSGISSGQKEKNGNPMIWVQNVYEDNRFIYVELMYGLNGGDVCIFDKTDGNTFLVAGYQFSNDIDDGPSFWPNYVCEDNTLVMYEDAYTLVHLESSQKPKDLHADKSNFAEIKNQITENSNPVIIVLHR